MFLGWGKWTEKDVIDEFGTDDELAAIVALPTPVAPPKVSPGIAAPPFDVEDLISEIFKAEGVSVEEELAKLPPLAPRDWRPDFLEGAHASESGYVRCCKLSLVEAIELADRCGAAVKR